MQNRSISASCLIRAFARVALLAIAGIATQARSAEAVLSEPQPATLPNSVYYDLKSAITGREYRLFVYAPADAGPNKAYPALYMFDGNRTFPQTADFPRGIVVGIGYPLQDAGALRARRQVDLTPTVDAGRSVPTGDADNFLRMLEEEIRPFVEARYNLIADQQSIYGYSFGGLAVLRHMFRHPQAFNNYILVSPSIWWDNKVVLADEAAFSARVKHDELKFRVLLTSAGDEQNCSAAGLNAAARAACESSRMVDNASDLAARLQVISPANVQVSRVVFAGETHGSVPWAAMGRTLSFLKF